jgi:predicted patatin/cPLA2 family phospholipase
MTQTAWDVDHPVLELLRQRRLEESKPGERSDAYKIGLAVEGGGMRGVVSAAMLTALDDRGFFNSVDSVYACSSGAINAAYYLAGGTWYPLSIYFDDLTTPTFVDLRRAFTKTPILNIDYAFNEVLANIKPLDYGAVLRSPVPLHVAITLVDELKTITTQKLDSEQDLQQALQASSWLPVALKGTTTYDGKRAVDGGVLKALPFRLAREDGCTHILSLSTHPMNVESGEISLLNRYTKRHLEKLRPGLGDGYIEALKQKYKDQEFLARIRVGPTYDQPYILDLAPLAGTPDVKRHEISVSRIIEAARSAYEVMYAALEHTTSSAISNGLIRAVPRFSIIEKDQDDKRIIHLVNNDSRASTPWGIARTRETRGTAQM